MKNLQVKLVLEKPVQTLVYPDGFDFIILLGK